MTVVIAIIVLVTILLLGVPIPFAFFASALTLVWIGGYDNTFLLPYGYGQVSSLILMAIPLFILAGELMDKSGIGESLINFVSLFIGRVRGGLGAVMVVSCGLFGAISGSGFATLSAIGSIMLPRMYEAGYPRGTSAALISSAALLGLLIPPSLNQILYAFVGGQSVLACFLATVGPGIVLIILFSAVNFWLLRNNTDIKLTDRIPKGERLKVAAKRTGWAVPAMLAPVIILGGIYGGFMTPTEAAAVSVVYTVPVGIWFYRGLDRKTFLGALIKAGTTAGVIMLMLLSVMMLSRLYVMENLPQTILAAMTSVSSDPKILTLMLNLFLLLIGMLMDDTSAILLTTPILLPVAMSVGIHPVHFSAIVGVNIGLGGVTPPTAPFLYLGSRVANAPVGEMLKPTMYLIFFAWIPTLIITTYFPNLSLWLPRLLGYA